MTIFVIVGVVIICSFLPLILSNFLPANHGAAVFADVTSANVVGYAPAALADRGVGVGACFITFNNAKIDLIDLKVTGYTGESSAQVEIQTRKPSGGTARTFQWYDYYEEPGVEDTHIIGWFEPEADFAPLEPNDVTLFPGEGLWAVCDGDGFTLTSSGEVPIVADVVTPLADRGRMVANPTPVTVDAAKCYISGYKGESSAEVEMQTLKSSGGTARTFQWYDYFEEPDNEDTHIIGWFEPEADFAPLEEGDVTCTAGRGLWLVCDGEGFNFCWPKVEL